MKPAFVRRFGGRVLAPANDPMIDGWRHSVTPTVSGSSSTTHAIAMPAQVQAGDLLLMLVAPQQTATAVIPPAGWDVVYQRGTTPDQSVVTGIFSRVATGSEGGGTATITIGASRHIAAQVHRISGAVARAGLRVSAAMNANFTGSNIFPPALTNSWGAGNASLWITGSLLRAAVSMSSLPSDYSGDFSTPGTNCSVVSAIRTLDALTHTPGNFGLSASTVGNAFTLCVAPIAQPVFSGPVIKTGPVRTLFNANTTAHLVDIPAVSTGDRILVHFVNDGSATVTAPSGYSPINSTAQSTNVRAGWYYRDAAGDESATTVDFVTSASEMAVATVYVLDAGTFHAATAPEAAVTNFGSGAPRVHASLSPSWGAGDTLFIASIGVNDSDAANEFWPSSHVERVSYATTSGTGGVTSTISGRYYRGASSYQPTSQGTGSRAYVSHTLGIRAA